MKRKLISCILIIFLICLLSQKNKCIAEGENRYTIDIEWGSLSFTYDVGTWNTNELKYCAEESSLFPANGTEDGMPGWYGFNGEANKITIYNSSESDEITANISISKDIKNTEGINIDTQPTYNSNLEYSIYKDNNWTCFEGYEEGNNTDITNVIPATENISYYISIKGELETENESFSTPRNIGSVTIQITK